MQKLDVNCFECVSNGLDKLVLAKSVLTAGLARPISFLTEILCLQQFVVCR